MSPPELLALLRKVSHESSQAEVARKTGFSSAVVCGVLKGTYTGNTEGFLRRFEEIYGNSNVYCPGLRESLSLSRCATYRKRPWSSINREWIRMHKACRTCDRNTNKNTPINKNNQ